MSERIYRSGLIVIGLLSLILTPLTATETVPPAFGVVALAALAGWIVYHQSTKRRHRREHDAGSD